MVLPRGWAKVYKGHQIGVVIPAYNEELLIADTLRSVPEFVDSVYVVNDGSTDRTAEIIQSFHDPRICCISYTKNHGVGAAIVSGYKQALAGNVDIVVVMAGDNQMDPAHMIKLISPIIEDMADYTTGDRLSLPNYNNGMSKWRFFGNSLLTWLTRIAVGNWHINDPQNGYTAISLDALKKIDLDSIYPSYGYCNDLLVKLTVSHCRIVNVPIPAIYGNEKSKINYTHYIPKLSWLLLRNLFWRLKVSLSMSNKSC
jgi:glycosyltransferase involved in cell wall biosynthesis